MGIRLGERTRSPRRSLTRPLSVSPVPVWPAAGRTSSSAVACPNSFHGASAPPRPERAHGPLPATYGPEKAGNGLIADPIAANDSLLNRLPEMEADEDAGETVLGRRLRKAEE